MIDRFGIVIGAMKSGTTTVVDALAAHPHVAAANPKEPGYFAFDDVFANGEAWYEGLFGFDPAIHKVAVEGSTDYTKHPFCPDPADRIRRFGRDMRLVFMMRHPLRRIESHARHVQAKKRELGRRVSDRPDHSLDAGVSPVSLAASRYAAQIDQYEDFLTAGRLHLAFLEDLEADPRSTVRGIFEFLQLDPDLAPHSIDRKNEKRTVVRPRAPRGLMKHALSLGPVTDAARAVIPAGMRARIREAMRPTIKIEGRFSLTAEEEATLTELLAPDLRRLRDRYKVDIASRWGLRV